MRFVSRVKPRSKAYRIRIPRHSRPCKRKSGQSGMSMKIQIKSITPWCRSSSSAASSTSLQTNTRADRRRHCAWQWDTLLMLTPVILSLAQLKRNSHPNCIALSSTLTHSKPMLALLTWTITTHLIAQQGKIHSLKSMNLKVQGHEKLV